jgi:cysteinyl-tRNA synthetase
MKHLGEYLDIHCGGVDNIFPHHTNEIAQSAAYLGHKWCNYWVHVQHLNDERGKMSKSSGEFLTLSLLESKNVNPLAYRLFCLQSHYRKPLTFSYPNMDNASASYAKLIKRVNGLPKDGEVDPAALAAYKEKFAEALSQDMNTAQGLTVLYDMLKDRALSGATKRAIVADFDTVLSLNLIREEVKTEKQEEAPVIDPADMWIVEKIEERAAAKKAKNYALADAIRAELLEKGITLVDTKAGTTFKKA